MKDGEFLRGEGCGHFVTLRDLLGRETHSPYLGTFPTWGHSLLGIDLALLSLFGIIALSGVVVNDSLLVVTFYNQLRRKGVGVDDALVEAGTQRFRPILLTSLTTFFGLLPMILEKSVQAQFLIPMAVSLGFGILFATIIILIGVPVGTKLLEQLTNPSPVKDKVENPISVATNTPS